MKRIVLLLLILLPLGVAAEEEEPPLLLHMPPTAPAGVSTTIITRGEIERSHYPYVLDVLRSVVGLRIVQAGGAGKPAFVLSRGSLRSQVQLMIDGVPINSTLLPVDLSHLTTTNVERIEVTQGAQAALFGSSAEAAVVNVITRHTGPFFSALGEYGSEDTKRGLLRSGAGSDANHYSIAFERNDTEGVGERDAYRNDTFGARAKVMVTQWTSVGLQYHDTRTDSPSLDSSYRLLSVPFDQQINPSINLQFRYSTYKQEVASDEARTSTYRVAARFRSGGTHEFLAGYEHEDSKTTAAEFTDFEIQNDAVFGEYHLTMPQLSATLALRGDNDNLNDSHVSPLLSASYKAAEHVSVFGSAGTAFRRPAVEELAEPLTSREKVTGVSAGVGLDAARSIHISAALFRNHYSGLFSPEAADIAEYTASGIELEGSTHPVTPVEIRANYAFASVDEFELSMEHSGSIAIAATQGKIRADFSWYISGENSRKESVNRADFSASYDFPRGFQVYARITNLFDTKYSELAGFPAPARSFYIGLRYQ